ncbi:Condensin-2 complex subunit H2 [Salvia divinorum]|uniref:Pectinesterase n=1 Tax=Salvia divinorum TaxID=28513 RepID=A0ABD1FWR2_SALDI
MPAVEESKRKLAVAGLTAILLAAAVIAVAVGSSKDGIDIATSGGDAQIGRGITATTKAVQAICYPTAYKKTCEESLADANTTDTRQLIQTAINVTEANVGEALENFSLLQVAARDPATKEAFRVCEDVLDRASADLRRTVGKMADFDFTKNDAFVADLRTWLSAAVTSQETCVDAFENTTGDTGEKMKKLLETATELTSNGLAMVTELATVINSFNLGSLGDMFGGIRRLLTAAEEENRRVAQEINTLTPDIVVAQDGSGQFETITEAIAAVKSDAQNSTVIHVKAGVYNEYVSIPKGKNKVVMIGDGPETTKVTGNKSIAGGVPTFYTATVDVNSEDFMGKDIGFENTAGFDGYQALALRVSGDRAIFYNVKIDGYQNSLCADAYRQFYRNCTITGTTDFVFGDALALFQNCTFIARNPGANQESVIFAQGRNDSNSNSVFVIQNGRITAEPTLLQVQPPDHSYLGHLWKPYSRTIIMHTEIDNFINPAGWSAWIGKLGIDTCYYGEYENTGPGSETKTRVTWPGIRKITPQIAKTWTGSVIYVDDGWIKKSQVQYDPNLKEI